MAGLGAALGVEADVRVGVLVNVRVDVYVCVHDKDCDRHAVGEGLVVSVRPWVMMRVAEDASEPLDVTISVIVADCTGRPGG